MTIYGANPFAVDETQTLSDFGYGYADVLRETASTVIDESPVMSLNNVIELAIAKQRKDSPRLSKDDALARAKSEGIDIDVPDEGLTQAAYDVLKATRLKQRRRDHVFNNREDDTGAWGMLGQFGVGIAASMVDPLNIATALVPSLAVARFSQIAKTTGSATFAGRIGQAAQAAPVRTATAEALVGAAAVEAIVLPSQLYIQSDYDLYDSMLNLGLGTAFAAGIQGIARGARSISEARQMHSAKVRADIRKAVAGGIDEVRARGRKAVPETASEKLLYANTETRNAVFHALVARAIEGRDIDIEAIIDADIDALAGRQVFELDEIEATLDEFADDIFGSLEKLLDETLLGKRKTERNKKLLDALVEAVGELDTKGAWDDYRVNARKQLKRPSAKRVIRRLAEAMNKGSEDAILKQIDNIRSRIEGGRKGAEIKAALDTLQARIEQRAALKELVIKNADELQRKIDQHPESIKRLENLRQTQIKGRTIHASDEQIAAYEASIGQQSALDGDSLDAEQLEKAINEVDGDTEVIVAGLQDTYPDADMADVDAAAKQAETNSRRAAELLQDSAACLAA